MIKVNPSRVFTAPKRKTKVLIYGYIFLYKDKIIYNMKKEESLYNMLFYPGKIKEIKPYPKPTQVNK